MTTWQGLIEQVPDFARAVRARFDAHGHKTMATLRRDGSPRICGTEVSFVGEDMWLAGMTAAVRFADLRRDPRVAIHSGSDDPESWHADAKVSGRAVQVRDDEALAAFSAASGAGPPGSYELFRLDVLEAVVVRLDDAREHLIIESWREGRGLRSVQR